MSRTQDTAIGGPHGRFPSTRRSVISEARSRDATVRTRGFEALMAAYWKPVYKYLRRQWNCSNEDAKDLTQGFFTEALEKDFFRPYDARKASFRTFLRTCLDGFVANQRKSATRLKRGGGGPLLSLDFAGAEHELRNHPAAGLGVDEFFEREWRRSLFTAAVETLQRDCQARGAAIRFRLFERYDLDGADLTYDQLAAEFGLTAAQVTNHLAAARRAFRRIVLDGLREIAGSEREFRQEARALLGIDVV